MQYSSCEIRETGVEDSITRHPDIYA